MTCNILMSKSLQYRFVCYILGLQKVFPQAFNSCVYCAISSSSNFFRAALRTCQTVEIRINNRTCLHAKWFYNDLADQPMVSNVLQVRLYNYIVSPYPNTPTIGKSTQIVLGRCQWHQLSTPGATKTYPKQFEHFNEKKNTKLSQRVVCSLNLRSCATPL